MSTRLFHACLPLVALAGIPAHARADGPSSILASTVSAVAAIGEPDAARARGAASMRAGRTSGRAARSRSRRLAGGLVAPGSARDQPATRSYAWREGGTYRLQTAPERVSDIALEPGEALIAVAAGDTARWVIGDTVSGSGASRRTHILVKPSAPGLRTNLVVTTDRRVYHVELDSLAVGAMASISWTYPEGALLALARAGSDLAAAPNAGGLAPEALNFAYRIGGGHPPWRPLRAFDDGAQVFIEFPPEIGANAAPPLFVLGANGKLELVNYRMRGRFYVVDRLFAAAELRIGEKKQEKVRITRIQRKRQAQRERAR